MIKSTDKSTRHWLVALNNYVLDNDDSTYLKYQFAYLYFDNLLQQKLTNFMKGSAEVEKQYFNVANPITLIDADYIYDNTHESEKGFEFVKLDSLSFLEHSPDLSAIKTLKIKGGIVCYEDYFTIEAELIPDGLSLSTIIYRSARIQYEKIRDLMETTYNQAH